MRALLLRRSRRLLLLLWAKGPRPLRKRTGAFTPCGHVASPEAEESIFPTLHERAEQAERDRGSLVEKWRAASKPTKLFAIAPNYDYSCRFRAQFAEWLRRRGLLDTLQYERQAGPFHVYSYVGRGIEGEFSWKQAYHGSWWYSLSSVLRSGQLLESADHSKGHDFWHPGVYCSPNIATARWYARPQTFLCDGVFHRLIFELRVNPMQILRCRQRGGVQWVFPSQAVSLQGLLVETNAPPCKGEERLHDWKADLEAFTSRSTHGSKASHN